MSFYPGISGLNVTFGAHSIKEVYYPEEYKNNDNEDYALLVLDRRIGDFTWYFGIGKYTKESLKNRKAYLYGYPADMPEQSQKEHYLWGMEGPFEFDQLDDMVNHVIYNRWPEWFGTIC